MKPLAVVTGASSGIGEATAIALAAAGAKVVLGDLNIEKLAQVKQTIIDNGGNAAACIVNVTDEKSVQVFMDFAVDQFGSINVVLACAGIIRDSYLVTPDRETGKVKKFILPCDKDRTGPSPTGTSRDGLDRCVRPCP